VDSSAGLDFVRRKLIDTVSLLDIKTEVLGRPAIQRYVYCTLYVLLNVLTAIFINTFKNGTKM
jgi:hypothetical protein